jgi:hypothetical protein
MREEEARIDEKCIELLGEKQPLPFLCPLRTLIERSAVAVLEQSLFT